MQLSLLVRRSAPGLSDAVECLWQQQNSLTCQCALSSGVGKGGQGRGHAKQGSQHSLLVLLLLLCQPCQQQRQLVQAGLCLQQAPSCDEGDGDGHNAGDDVEKRGSFVKHAPSCRRADAHK